MIAALKAAFRRMPGHGAMSLLRMALTDSATARLLMARPDGLFQPFGTTSAERYAGLFDHVRARIGDGPDRRLLSFGCSTGEEVFSLRRRFPQAGLKGIDISAARIKRCRRRLRAMGGDGAITFAAAGSAEAEPEGCYDAVFAMAVFRHGRLGGAPPRCDHLISFAEFERIVAGLARCLRPGGLLVLRHANFRFADTAAAAEFVPELTRPALAETPVYGPDNRLCPAGDSEAVIFCKKA